MQRISQQQLIDFYAENIVPGAAKRRALTVHVLPAAKFAAEVGKSGMSVPDVVAFRSKAELWPDEAKTQ